MKRLFGTDGVRGLAGEFPLDGETVRRLGYALGEMLGGPQRDGAASRVLIGRDTRESGPMIEASLSGGLKAARAHPCSIGVVSTPALAYLTREGGFAAGVMISASHNPYRDNGIKILGPDGMKMPDSKELTLERMVLDRPAHDIPELPLRETAAPPLESPADGLLDGYRRHLVAACGGVGVLAGLSVVLDCAHGGASGIAPRIFESLGARVRSIGCEPTGRNINERCGALHLERLCEEVLRTGADIGLAFDGDADRCLAVDRTGRPLDGDFILYLQARRMQRAGRLRGDAVVATVMSNLWLERGLAEEGIRLIRAPVGDKYVLERMLEENASLGGEQSGHIIFLDHFPTGDGVLTGLLLASAVKTEGLDLAAIASGIRKYPQVLLNVRVREKPILEHHETIGPAIRRLEQRLAGEGRVLVRYSGTEPLARVMIEGADEETVRSAAEQLAGLIRREIGADG